LVLGQRSLLGTATIDPVADTPLEGRLPIRLLPVRLIAEDLAFFSVQQLRHLTDVRSTRMGRGQAVDDAAPIRADVGLHPEVPLSTLLALAHLRVTRLLGVLRRGRRGNDRGIDEG